MSTRSASTSILVSMSFFSVLCKSSSGKVKRQDLDDLTEQKLKELGYLIFSFHRSRNPSISFWEQSSAQGTLPKGIAVKRYNLEEEKQKNKAEQVFSLYQKVFELWRETTTWLYFPRPFSCQFQESHFTFAISEEGYPLKTMQESFDSMFLLYDLQKMLFQVLRCLAFLHENDYVHLSVDRDHIVGKIIADDWKVLTDKTEFSLLLQGTKQGEIPAIDDDEIKTTTPLERLLGKEIDQKADIWSLGIIILELLTKKPFVEFSSLQERPFELTGKIQGLFSSLKNPLEDIPDASHLSETQQGAVEEVRKACQDPLTLTLEKVQKTYREKYTNGIPDKEAKCLEQILKIVKDCLQIDPRKRPSACDLLKKDLFADPREITLEMHCSRGSLLKFFEGEEILNTYQTSFSGEVRTFVFFKLWGLPDRITIQLWDDQGEPERPKTIEVDKKDTSLKIAFEQEKEASDEE